MPTALISRRSALSTCIIAAALLIPLASAAAQRKAAAPPAPPQAQLEERLAKIQDRLNTEQLQTERAAMEKDYLTRTQKQYEAYYEKAFNAQVLIVSILGAFLAVMFGIASWFGLGIFDRRIDSALKETSAQLRTEFTEMLAKETKALREANAAQMKKLEAAVTARMEQLEEDLAVRSDFQYQFAQGMILGADDRHADAQKHYRIALMSYKRCRSTHLISRQSAAGAAANVFRNLRKEDDANFEENARKELARKLYNGLDAVLAIAALSFPPLGPLLKERQEAPSPAPAATAAPPEPDTEP